MRTDAKITTARRFRKNLTSAELLLWLRLRRRHPGGPIFRSQHPLGSYVLDFYCAKAKLCVEVDGIAHTTEPRSERDEVRDIWLMNHMIMTYRIPAPDLFADPDGVADGVVLLALSRSKTL